MIHDAGPEEYRVFLLGGQPGVVADEDPARQGERLRREFIERDLDPLGTRLAQPAGGKAAATP